MTVAPKTPAAAQTTTTTHIRPIAVKAPRVPRSDAELRARHELVRLVINSWWKIAALLVFVLAAFTAASWVTFIQPERELTHRAQILAELPDFERGSLMCAARADYALDKAESWQWRRACFELMLSQVAPPDGPKKYAQEND